MFVDGGVVRRQKSAPHVFSVLRSKARCALLRAPPPLPASTAPSFPPPLPLSIPSPFPPSLPPLSFPPPLPGPFTLPSLSPSCRYSIVSRLKWFMGPQASTSVRHLMLPCHWSQRPFVIQDLVRCYGALGRSIIFTETKKDANELLSQFGQAVAANALHGDIPQQQREVRPPRPHPKSPFSLLPATLSF